MASKNGSAPRPRKGRAKKGEDDDAVDASKKKPKRPLHAYNLFYKFDRERLLAGGDRTDLPVTVEDVQRLSRLAKDMPRRAHRRAHGKIAFLDLCRTIADRWKNLPPESKRVFEQQAELEKQEYDKKLVKWNNEQVEGTNAKSDAASAAASEDPPDSSVAEDQYEDSPDGSSAGGGGSEIRPGGEPAYEMKASSLDGEDDQKVGVYGTVSSASEILSSRRLPEPYIPRSSGHLHPAFSRPARKQREGMDHYSMDNMDQERQRAYAAAHSHFDHSHSGSGLVQNISTSAARFSPYAELRHQQHQQPPYNAMVPFLPGTFLSSSQHSAASAGASESTTSSNRRRYDGSSQEARRGAPQQGAPSQNKEDSPEMGTLFNPLDEETMDTLFD